MKQSNSKKDQNQLSRKIKGFTRGFYAIHKHRYFRRLFCLLIVIHVGILLIPVTDQLVEVPESVNKLLIWCNEIWPFPTFKMSTFYVNTTQIYIRNILFKTFEIIIIMFYVVDLLPKIFSWKKRFLWKMLNAIVVSLMVT